MKNEQNTEERILEAATGVFAAEGFKSATVRKICKKAHVNVAAVNYHFRGKAGLYAAVIEKLFSAGMAKFPPDKGFLPHMGAEEKLGIFIRNFFIRLAGEKIWIPSGSHIRLMLRELSEPTPGLDIVVQKFILPHKQVLSEIVREILGDTATEEKQIRCMMSIMAQCVHYSIARPIIERVAQEYTPKEADIEKISAHITRFSLGGIQEIMKNAEKDCLNSDLSDSSDYSDFLSVS